MDATVGALSEAQQNWINAQLAAAAQFVADYGSHRAGSGLTSLDHAWASWLDRQSVEPEDPNPVINAVGVALGQALVEALPGFDWVSVTEADRADLAIFGLPDTGDVLIYPADLVAKEYQARTSSVLSESEDGSFLSQARDRIVGEVRQLRG